jgi:hypothetical protein
MPRIFSSRITRLFVVLSLWWTGLASAAYYAVLLVYSASLYKRRDLTFAWMFDWQSGWNAWGEHGVIPFFKAGSYLVVTIAPIAATSMLIYAARFSNSFVRGSLIGPAGREGSLTSSELLFGRGWVATMCWVTRNGH